MKLRFAVFALLIALVSTLSAQVPASRHVVVVVEENHNYAQVIGSSTMPYLNSLANQYGLATQYYANTHPSIGNYFMMTTGQIITNNDSYTGTVTADNLVRHLLSAGKTWKSYAEGLPSVGYVGGDTGLYARRHNPFTYLSDVINSSVQKMNLVPFTQFATDLNNNALPDISFVIPNLINDAHDGTLQQADAWLQSNIAPLLSNSDFQQDGILVVVFDESASDNTHGGGRVAFVAAGPTVKPGVQSTLLHQHQSLLRMISEAVGLTTFPGAAATATDMTELFAQVTLNPTSLTFGSQGVGTTSASQAVTLTNNQGTSVTGINISASGDFGQTNNCGTTLAANSSCTINVTFTPSAVGTRTGTLTVNDSAGTQTSSLTGTGIVAITLSPSSLNFGNQGVGITSSPQALTLTNNQSVVLTGINISITGANAGDYGQSGNCGTSLAANSSCTINVTFTPSAVGTRTGTLTVNDSAGTQTSSLTGTGIVAVTLSPSSLNFGNQGVGITSSPQALTLTNNQSVALTGINVSITGANAGDYGQSGNCGTSLAANSSCTINVTFTPSAVGTSTGTLTVNDSAGTQTSSLTGTGIVAVTLSPSSLNFGNQGVGITSSPQALTLTNNQSVALTGINVSITGANAGDYGQSGNCGTSLAANSSCTINVTFTPSAVGTRTGTLRVNDSAGTQTSNLTGTGVVAVTLSPSSLNFGNQGVGITSSPQALTLTNNQSVALTGINVSITGANAGDYGQSGNCGTSLAANSSCTINVTFTPSAVGTRTGTLTVNDSAGTQTSNLTGTGIVAVTLSPSSLNFGNQGVGITSSPQALTLTNNQSVALTGINVSITGANAGDYGQSGNCGTSLAANSSCTINVTFTPSAVGTRTGTLTVNDSAGTQTSSLTGTGIVAVTLSPSSLNFGNQGVGITSSPQALTLTNNQSVALTGINVSITGANAGDYGQSGNCGTTLAANSSCTINVTFTPSAVGTRTGTLRVNDSAGTQTTSLTGTGKDVTPPTTQIIAPTDGATVSGTITVTATASDNVGVTSLQIYIDGTLQSSGTSSPLNFSWDTSSVSNGPHTIYSKASDAAGNVSTSTTIAVTVNNSQGPYGVVVTAPINNSILHPSVHFVASASSDVPIATMAIYVDGQLKWSQNVSSLDTYLTLPGGRRTVVVQAVDQDGKEYTKALLIYIF